MIHILNNRFNISSLLENFSLFSKKIYDTLLPGGMFVNADQASGETVYFSNPFTSYWTEFILSGPFHEKEHLEILQMRSELDRNEKMSDQLKWRWDLRIF